MSDSIEYRRKAELKILKLFDAVLLLDDDINLDLINLDIQYIYCSIIEKFSEETIKKFIKFSINLIKYSHKTLAYYLKKKDENDNLESTSQIKYILTILSKFIRTIVGLSEKSLEFCCKFHEEESKNGVKVLLEFITDDLIVSFLNKYHDHELKEDLNDCFSVLYNLTIVFDQYRDKWGEMNTFKILLDLTDKIEDEESKLRILMIIGNIASDDELNNILTSTFLCLSSVLERFVRALSDENFFNENCFTRELVQIEKDQPKVEVIQELGRNLVQCLQTFFKFSINDKLKMTFYEELNLKTLLKKIIYNGNKIEKEYSIGVLSRLCFDRNVANDLKKDKTLVSFMTSILHKKKDVPKGLARKIKGILWILNDETNEMKLNEVKESIDSKSVFISSNRENLSICLRIKKYLESSTQKFLINQENEETELLDSMSKCISLSTCALVCINKKYKNSFYCRIEANELVKNKKLFIPILIEKSFKPDGW